MLIRYSRHTDSFTITDINVRIMKLLANGYFYQPVHELMQNALTERDRVRADFYATHKRKRPEGSAE